MQAISLWQPWATLIAIGAKRFETRSWPMTFKEPFAIHAAKRWNRTVEALCNTEPFLKHLDPLRATRGDSFKDSLPFGCIIAVCDSALAVQVSGGACKAFLFDGTIIRGDEFHFGDYWPGRYASHLGPVRRLKTPIPFAGKQGPFNVPDELISEAG